MIEFLTVYILLGIHSAWLLVRLYTRKYDFTTGEIHMLVFAFLFPIVAHMATIIVYSPLFKNKVLFKKKV